jgi:hypothetical protein
VAAGLISGQVKKSDRRRQLVRVTHVMRLGTEAALKDALQGLGFSGRLNTAFLERLNLTVRHGVSALARHLGHGEARSAAPHPPGMVASLFSFCASPRIATSGAHTAGSREVADFWRSATGSVLKLWQREEPTDSGQRAKSFALLCRKSPCFTL